THHVAQLEDAPQTGDVARRIAAAPAGAHARIEQPQLLVVAQRAGGHARLLGHLTDAQQRLAHTGTGSSAGSGSAWTYLVPRIHDAHAAMRHMSSDAVKAMRRPCRKGPAMRWGKNVLPVRVCHWAWVTPAADSLPSSFSIGL